MDLMNPPIDDHEGKMAKADLYKLAEYSIKLFKMIEDDDELQGWVQAKITKASDYISSVYHYLEYEQLADTKIESGPLTYEEQVQLNVSAALNEQWNQQKQGNQNGF